VSATRFVSWGHWGIGFWEGDRNDLDICQAIAQISFPVGPCGPMDGTLGSREHLNYQRMCSAWVDTGEMPDGAHCPLESAWLYDPDYPGAIWVERRGWTSPVRVGKTWVYPQAAAS